jgi:hypothetical protein
MTRYVTRDWIDHDTTAADRETPQTITVHESRDASDTGLVDAAGVRIYRVSDRVPMGFRPTTG